jgi:uncharacterized repeat protein (TIGR02543 family)
MKKLNLLKKILFVGVICIMGVTSFVACSSSISDPLDLIKQNYGDKEFKISFSSKGLNEPLSDVIYTANNIPKLPTPTKVGYRFSGWYFDEAYTKPYDSEYLYTKMCDVTLYAKWEEEEFINNGIYEIEYEAHILEDSIVKGKLADTYGYLEFPDLIISDETYIEKNENGVFLRIQYDMKYHCPTIDDDGNLGTLTVAVSDNDGRISSTESIIDRTGTIETVYYDLSSLNIADSIYLNVEFYNWNAKLNNESNRVYTKVGYQVEFNITNFIGYTTSYVDANDKLEDGYYLVKTHYASLNKEASMLDTFNPVYSYIEAKNGQYKLIKPMNAYNSDIIGDLAKSDYTHVKTGYARDIAYFKFDQSIVASSEDVNENFGLIDWANYLNAQEFGELSYEFDANTGKYYYVFDLGDKANVDLLLIGASTGAMTEMFNMGPTYKRLVIDYSSMVKLSSIDYTPLSGNTYSYYNSQPFYLYTDFSSLKDNTIYDTEMEYGMSNDLITTFFSSYDGENVNELYSTKMTIKPLTTTSIQENKGNIFTFQMVYECYGYDPTTSKAPLYQDYISWQTFSTYSQRFNNKVELGYEATNNEIINIYDLYRSKIYPTLEDTKLKYKAYKLKANGEVDYSSPFELDVSINNTFKYTQDFALYLEGEIDGNYKSGVINIVLKKTPKITINDEYTYEDEDYNITWTYDEKNNYYVSDKYYTKGSKAHIPEISYTSYGNSYTSLDAYDSINETYHMNQEKISIYTLNNNGIYTKVSYNYEVWNDSIFDMTSDEMVVVYHLVDRYGYCQNITLVYKGQEATTYSILRNDEEVTSGVQYYYSDGTRRDISVTNTEALNLESISEAINAEYTLKVGSNKYAFTLENFECYTKTKTTKGTTISELQEGLKDAEYALICFTYKHGDDTYVTYYVYNLRINGKDYSSFNATSNNEYFTNTSYLFNTAMLMDNNGTLFSTAYPSFSKYSGGYYKYISEDDMTNTSSNYTFLKSGRYKISYTIGFNEDENEDQVLYVGSKKITISEEFVVHSLDEEITLSYKTDKNHPFRDDLENVTTLDNGDQIYSLKIKQSEENFSLDKSYFKDTKDNLYKWGYLKKNGTSVDYVNPGAQVKNVGAKLNSTTPVLVTIWDEGIVVNAQYTINGVTYSLGSKTYYRSNNGYVLTLSDFSTFVLPSGNYEFIGWKSDKKIFYEQNGSDKIYSYKTSHTNDTSFIIEESCTIEALIKEPINVRFYTYTLTDGSIDSNDFVAMNFGAQQITEDKTLKEGLSNGVYKLVSKKEKDTNFKYYAVYIDGKFVQIDLDETSISKSYLNNGLVYVVAVYEGE